MWGLAVVVAGGAAVSAIVWAAAGKPAINVRGVVEVGTPTVKYKGASNWDSLPKAMRDPDGYITPDWIG